MIGAVDTLRYVIEGNTSKYNAAIDKSHSKTTQFDQKVKGLGSSMSSLIPIASSLAGAAALGAVVNILDDGIRSFAEWERRQLRTEALIKATGNAAGITAQELSQFANQLDLATLANRDNILDAINIMQTFKSVTGNTFKESIKLSLDLAEVFGGVVSDKAVQLGKALEDPITGLSSLKRVGVDFTESQKDLIKSLVESGEKARAQGIILEVLKGQVAGSAEGAAGGLAGSIDTLSFRWREFKETLVGSETTINSIGKAIDLIAVGLEKTSAALGDPNVQKFLEFFAGTYGAGVGSLLFGGGGGGEQRFPIGPNTPGYNEALAAEKGAAENITPSTEEDPRIINEQKLMEQYQERFEEWVRIEYLQQQYEEAELAATREREEEKRKIRQATMQTALQQGKFALREFGKNNEAAMTAYKAIAITETTINTAKAAMAAYSAMAGIPIVGPALGVVAAAAAIAYGAAQINAIASESTGGSGGGGAVGSYPASPTTGMPEIEPAEAKNQKPAMHIHIEGPMIGNDEFINDIVEKINYAKDREVYIEYTRGTI